MNTTDLRAVPFTHARVAGDFWGPRIETNRRVTIPFAFGKCRETPRVENFANAGRALRGEPHGPFVGIRFDDSDVYKVIEGAAYSLATHPDAELDASLDELIATIAAAQEPDGYLFTCRTIDPDNLPRDVKPERWSFLRHSHELYNLGHLYEAAAAHFRATGKRSLLNVAIKSAELVLKEFNEKARRDPPGHEEIELGLAKLFGVTGDRRYLDAADFFLACRGRHEGRESYGSYSQDHAPAAEQSEAVGHAVRAGYLYAGMADVAALAGKPDYLAAVTRIFGDIVSTKLALTGGIGARHEGEAFGDPFELPNAESYNETCAAISLVYVAHRLFLATGMPGALDVLERTLYNGLLSGVSLDGDKFFYVNPLAADGEMKFNAGSFGRQEWFGTSCCPGNLARFLPSLAGYAYAADAEGIYVNLYAEGGATVEVGGVNVEVEQRTRYPWDGAVRLTVSPDAPAEFEVRLRIPGWATGRPVPSDLYRFSDEVSEPWALSVNGEPQSPAVEEGYAILRRGWKAGDTIDLALPMPVRRVVADDRVEADRGRVALQRGPLVYCFEGVDHPGKKLEDLRLPDDLDLAPQHRPDLLGGVMILTGGGLRAVPYYAWNHRGAGEMAVWLRRAE